MKKDSFLKSVHYLFLSALVAILLWLIWESYELFLKGDTAESVAESSLPERGEDRKEEITASATVEAKREVEKKEVESSAAEQRKNYNVPAMASGGSSKPSVPSASKPETGGSDVVHRKSPKVAPSEKTGGADTWVIIMPTRDSDEQSSEFPYEVSPSSIQYTRRRRR